MQYQGMYLDGQPLTQPEGTYRHALNKVVSLFENALLDEEGVTEIDLGEDSGDILYTIPVTFNRTILFRQDTISIFDGTDAETIIVRDALLNIQPGLKGVSFKNYKANAIIVWVNGDANPIRFLNIDDPDLDLNVDKSFTSPNEVNKLKFFPEYQVPEIYKATVNDSGGSLKSGTVSLAVAYETKDGFLTDFAIVSNPVFVTKDSMGKAFTQVEGCLPGTQTSKLITFDVRNLDRKFEKVVFAVIEHIGSEESGKIVAFRNMPASGEMSYTYTGAEFLEPISVADILINNAKYNTAKTLTLTRDSLYFANLKVKPRVDYQEFANNIFVNWVYGNDADDIISLTQARDSYKNGSVSFLDKTFLPGEVMALYIRPIMRDGSRAEAFHIPGRSPGVISLSSEIEDIDENIKISDLLTDHPSASYLQHDLSIDENIKLFHTRETAWQTGSEFEGKMGYWENEEVYPEWFPGLAGQPVRHHKLPGLRLLSTLHDHMFNNGYTSGISGSFDFDVREGVVNNINDLGELFITSPTKVTFNKSGFIIIKGFFSVKVSGPQASVTCRILHNGIPLLDRYEDNIQHENPINFYEGVDINVDISEGDYIEYEFTWTGIEDDPADGNLHVTFSEQGSGVIGTTTRKLGIRLDNIVIPAGFPDIQGFEILYAKRDYQNATIIAYSPLLKNDNPSVERTFESTVEENKEARFYAPDLLANDGYPYAQANFFSTELLFSGARTFLNYNSSDSLRQTYTGFYTPALEIRKIEDVKYDPYTPDKMMETALIGVLPRGFTPPESDRALVALKAYRRNVYTNFLNQELITTGRVFYVDGSGVYSTGKVFGGDAYLGEYSVWQSKFAEPNAEGDYNKYECTSFSRAISWFTYSALNPGLRYEGDNFDQKYYPKTSFIPRDFFEDTDMFLINHCYLYDNYHRIDFLTTKTNVHTPQSVFDKGITFTSDFPTRIIGGSIIQQEGTGAEARTFKLNDYYEMPRNKGEILNLEWFLTKMFIHHEDTLFVASTDTKLENTDYEILLGAGKLFSIPPQEILTAQGGYAGLQHVEAARLTKGGYFFIDDRRGEVFLFGEDLTTISNAGLREFFKTNPLVNNGNYTIGYDDEHKRLILTKNSATPYTLSYSLQTNKWVSFHSYTPYHFFIHANTLHAAKDGTIYKHGNKAKRATYYDGTQEPTYVDIVFNPDGSSKNLFYAFKWKTTSFDNQRNAYPLETFTKAFVYSDLQMTNEIALTNKTNIRSLDGEWRFNSFRDLLDPDERGKRISDARGVLNVALLDLQMDWKLKKRFINNWVILRLINSNAGDNILYLHSAQSYQRKAY